MTKNILTITLNPAVDKSATVQNIKPEKKLRCSQPKYEPGGGGINVSRGLQRLGTATVAFFPAGGRTGELMQELLEAENVKTLTVEVAAATRENFVVVDTSNNEQYRFGMPGEGITPAECESILQKIQSLTPFPEIAVISGSLPPNTGTGFMVQLIALLKKNGALVIADTSGSALQAAIDEGVYLIKPNLGELSRLSGKPELDNETANDAAKQIIQKGGAKVVAVSMGPQGAYLVSANETVYMPAPSVKKLSTVGAGDSMVAGMAHSMAKGGTLTDMARMGVACGSAATMNPGTGLFKKEDAERLYKWLAR